MRSTLVRLIVLLTAGAAAGTAYYLVKRIPERKQEIPMVQVKRGDLTVRSFVRGELRAVRSALLTTPNLGTTAQITQLAPAGALAQAKDLIVEFDDSELLAALEDAELDVASVNEQIKRAEADQASRQNQDQVDLLRARFNVRKAELEVKRNELISKIDARKNELTLEEAKRALAKLEEDVKSRLEQSEAELAVLREQRRKALLEVRRVKTRLDQTRLLAPITGLVSIKENRSGGFYFGQQMPDIREGDALSPGTPVAEILDLSELEVSARVNEIERASLHEGQEVLVRLDALPGAVVHGKIKTLSGTASANIFSSDPAKKFDCIFSVDMREMLAQVGATPQQINRILATAAQNAKTFGAALTAGGITPAPAPPAGGPMVALVRPGGEATIEFGGPGGNGGGRAFRGPGPGGEGGPRGGFAGPQGLSDADRQRMREAVQKALGGRDPQSMSPEERQKLFAELRQKMGGGAGPAGGAAEGGFRSRTGASGEGGRSRMGRGGPGGGEGAEGNRPTEPDLASLSLRQAGVQQFTAEERAKAQLPPPPEEGSVMDVLLRPGLLVEAEIIVDKIPNTLYVPLQAVFEKGGRTVVFVRSGDRFEARPVKLGQRTESQVAVLGGVREGEWVALQDMETGPQPSKKDKGGAKDKSKPQQPALPAAGPKAALGLPGAGSRG